MNDYQASIMAEYSKKWINALPFAPHYQNAHVVAVRSDLTGGYLLYEYPIFEDLTSLLDMSDWIHEATVAWRVATVNRV